LETRDDLPIGSSGEKERDEVNFGRRSQEIGCFRIFLYSLMSGLPLQSFFCVAGGFTTTTGKRKGSPCQQDDDGDSNKPLKITRSSIEDLSEVLRDLMF
jgi:hypothetical protein